MDPLTIAAGLSTVGSIAKGIFGSDASADAIKLQKKALKQQAAFSNQALGYQQPYREAGETGLTHLMDILGLGNSQAGIAGFESSPLYKLLYGSAIDQGNKAILATAGSRGQLNSGSTRTGITDQAARTTRGFLGDYISGLGDITSRGERAATAAGNIAVGQGTNAVNGASAIGDLTLARGLGTGNTIGNGLGDLASILGQRSAQGSSLYGGDSYNPGVGPGGMGYLTYGGPR